MAGPKFGFGSARLMTVIRQNENILKRTEATQRFVRFAPSATSDGLGWKALQAVRYRNSPVSGEAESFATVLTVHLIRHITGSHREPASADGVLPGYKLRMVIEYIMENLGGSPTLEQMAAVVQLSPYHFARQFKAATGLAPHQYVITRPVARAQHLLRTGGELGLAEVAFRSGFANQSHFCLHFKRFVGVTPRQVQISARICQNPQDH